MRQICIKNFLTEAEAELAKNILEKQNIKSVIQTEGRGVAIAGAFGASLFVLEKDAKKASELLSEE